MDEAREQHRKQEAQWSLWMAAAQQGDAESYETLLTALLPVLRAYAGRRIANQESAEDLVQTVLLSIHRARHTYRPERPFGPWFWAIARNALIDAQPARTAREHREVQLPDSHETLQKAHSASDADDAGVQRRDLERALGQLPDRQEEAVRMIHLEGLSVKEAAQRAGTTAGALKVRAHRGYRALRRLLEEAEPDV